MTTKNYEAGEKIYKKNLCYVKDNKVYAIKTDKQNRIEKKKKRGRILSAIESVTNALISYIIHVIVLAIIIPYFIMKGSLSIEDNTVVSIIFTIISIVRNYLIRIGFIKIKRIVKKREYNK